MLRPFHTLFTLLSHDFDAVIDVRSPSEFAHDHVPGAINLPVLDDAQRAQVGTIYVQQSAFLARKVGGAMVYRNAANHIENHLKDFDGAWRPLIYCWRGGQRSGSFTQLLRQIGWRAETIDGGYQTYRRLVNRHLYKDSLPFRLIALDGNTGTAKTDLLHHLAARGVQVIDLEGAAQHRGSLLGGCRDPQPSQKAFETALIQQMAGFDPMRPVVIEAESNKIGARVIPPAIWNAMKSAPRIEITAPHGARVTYLCAAYDDILSDAPRLIQKLSPLRRHRGNRMVDHWLAFLAAGDRAGLVSALISQHYDPSYLKSRRMSNIPSAVTLATSSLDDSALNELANRIEQAIAHDLGRV
jgi:tRNA 2-selenouridine synthase